MVRLDRHFKAPPQRATRQWLKVELLVAFGEDFFSSHSLLDKHCATLADTVSYLVKSGYDKKVVLGRLEQIRKSRTAKP